MALPSLIQAFISNISILMYFCVVIYKCIYYICLQKYSNNCKIEIIYYILASFNDQVYTYTFVKEKFRD